MNRWFFWVLAPVMLATGLVLPFITEPPTWQGKVLLYLICGTLVFATLGLARPRRFRWALRAVAGVIVLVYVAYAASEALVWWQGKPFGPGAQRAESNLSNALWGLMTYGLPSLYFLLRGRSGRSVDVLLDVEDESNGPLAEGPAIEQGDEADEA
jgi:hypothetical protein